MGNLPNGVYFGIGSPRSKKVHLLFQHHIKGFFNQLLNCHHPFLTLPAGKVGSIVAYKESNTALIGEEGEMGGSIPVLFSHTAPPQQQRPKRVPLRELGRGGFASHLSYI